MCEIKPECLMLYSSQEMAYCQILNKLYLGLNELHVVLVSCKKFRVGRKKFNFDDILDTARSIKI